MIRQSDIERVLNVCKRNMNNKEVLNLSALYLSMEYSKSDDSVQNLNLDVFQLVESFGSLNIDLNIFKELDRATDKIARREDVVKAIDNIKEDKMVETSFWVLAHLIDSEVIKDIIDKDEFVMIERKVSEFINDQKEFYEHYAETVGFLYYLNQSFPEKAAGIIRENEIFFERLIGVMKQVEGNKRELGLLVMESFIGKEKYETILLQLDVIKWVQQWIKDAKTNKEL